MCCGCGFGGPPPWGVPIEKEEYDLLPEDIKDAFDTFEAWWNTVHLVDGIVPVDETQMPDNVKVARDMILATPIPGYDDVTCADSCTMIVVQNCFDLFRRKQIKKS